MIPPKGIEAGDTFIGGDGKDAELIGAFKDYQFQQAADAQKGVVIDQNLNQLLSEGVSGTVTSSDEAAIKMFLLEQIQMVHPIFTLQADLLELV